MNDSHQDEPVRGRTRAGAQEQLTLAQLLALARARTIDEQNMALERVEDGGVPAQPSKGDPYLLFTCANVPCAAPLTQFREVLPVLPVTVALPFSPSWMLGFFALHTELIGVVDPAPLLFEMPELATISRSRVRHGRIINSSSDPASGAIGHVPASESGPTALVVGYGERMLALAVGGVGDLTYVEPEMIRGDYDVVGGIYRPATRFGGGVYVRPEDQAGFHILKIDLLLEALLDALTQADAEAPDHE